MPRAITERQRVLNYFVNAPAQEALELYNDLGYVMKQRRPAIHRKEKPKKFKAAAEFNPNLEHSNRSSIEDVYDKTT